MPHLRRDRLPDRRHLAGCGPRVDAPPFDYSDTWKFVDIGKPLLCFVERTTRDGAPAHTESGYCASWTRGDRGDRRFLADRPDGLGTGSVLVEGDVLTLVTEAAVVDADRHQVTRLVRTFTLSGDTLDYRLDMDWAGGSQERHLSSTMTRVRADAAANNARCTYLTARRSAIRSSTASRGRVAPTPWAATTPGDVTSTAWNRRVVDLLDDVEPGHSGLTRVGRALQRRGEERVLGAGDVDVDECDECLCGHRRSLS